MPPRNMAIFFCWALVLLVSSPAAGILSIELETTLGTKADRLQGTLKITNKGDEPALDLRAEITLPHAQLRREITRRLEAKAFVSLPFEGRLTGLQKGSYPLTITVIFHDANLYPFSALACPVFSCGEEGRGDLSCTALPATVGEKGEISFTLKSKSSAVRTIQAMVFLPREFQSPRPRFSLTLEPHASGTLSFPVLNTSALQGATYPIFGVFQYETEDLQQALVIPTTLRIAEKGNWFAETRWYWLLGGVLFGMITLWTLFKKKIT